MDVVEFAAARNKRLVSADDDMRPLVAKTLADQPINWDDVVEGASVLWLEIFQGEAPKAYYDKVLADFQQDLRDHLKQTTTPDSPPETSQVDRVTMWIGTYVVNNATFHAARAVGEKKMRWVTMHDASVRHTHAEADGQVVSVNGTFDIGGYKLHYPGEPIGPAEIWINCRCLLASGKVRAMTAAATPTDEKAVNLGDDPDEQLPEDVDLEGEEMIDDPVEVPFHAVLAPEGIPTGDGRQFAVGALSARDLPLPLSYQYQSTDGHGGSIVIGRFDEIWRDERNYLLGRGVFNMNEPMAQRVVEDIANGFTRGLSVDVDDIEVVQPDTEDEAQMAEVMAGTFLTVFSKARVAGATVVAIPAFQEAYVGLGPDFPSAEALAACGCTSPEVMGDLSDLPIYDLTDLTPEELALFDGLVDDETRMAWLEENHPEAVWDDEFRDVSPTERKRLAKSGEAMPDGSFPIANVSDLKNAIQSVGRAKDIAAAKAHIKKRAKALGASDLIPEDWSALTASAFAPGTHDGPGWITHPRATARIRRYWVSGKGAAKIRWGQPGDFNRCRKQLAKYVQNPDWLAGLCANMHKEAIGIWPGMEDGGRRGHHDAEAITASAVNLVDTMPALPAAMFANPNLTEPVGVIVEDDGHVYGYVATWSVCHIGIDRMCKTAPHSASDYAMFATGFVKTDDGQQVRVGQITMGTGHADIDLGARPAAYHYDNTGSAVADIAVGEDGIGIWFSGMLRPSATPEQIHALRASGRLSGDWRQLGAGLEMVAALAVNVPGFPIPAEALAASGGFQTALVAAGIVEAGENIVAAAALDTDTIVAISRNAVAEYRHQEKVAATVGPIREKLRERRLAGVRARFDKE